MKKLFAFVRKEFHHILRDKRTMLILLGMPIVQVILFGFALSVEIRNINVAFINPESDESIRPLMERIDANVHFTVVGRLHSVKEIGPLMQRDRVDVVVRFARHQEQKQLAGESPLQILVDASNPNTAATETLFLQQIIRQHYAEQQVAMASTGRIQPVIRMLYNPRMESSYNFVPGIMGLILLIICAMMTSVSIVREREVGTMEVLLVSPVKPLHIILAKMVPYFVLSCINLLTILLLARFVLGVPLSGSLGLLSLVSLIYLLLALALGLLISTLVKTQVAAMICSAILLLMPVMMLSGMIFPVESMPRILQVFSDIVPAKWYIAAMRKLMIEGLGFSGIYHELLILTTMAVGLITIALANFKNRLE